MQSSQNFALREVSPRTACSTASQTARRAVLLDFRVPWVGLAHFIEEKRPPLRVL